LPLNSIKVRSAESILTAVGGWSSGERNTLTKG
jgi:hypothetical protein